MGLQVSDIQFSWNGKEYTVKKEVYKKDFIVLPNRKVLRAIGLGTFPPNLNGLEEVIHHLEHAPVGEIAEHMGNAILAREED